MNRSLELILGIVVGIVWIKLALSDFKIKFLTNLWIGKYFLV